MNDLAKEFLHDAIARLIPGAFALLLFGGYIPGADNLIGKVELMLLIGLPASWITGIFLDIFTSLPYWIMEKRRSEEPAFDKILNFACPVLPQPKHEMPEMRREISKMYAETEMFRSLGGVFGLFYLLAAFGLEPVLHIFRRNVCTL